MSKYENFPQINELFDSNEFDELFDLATKAHLQAQESNAVLGKFFKLLNLETLKALVKEGKTADFLDSLIPFLQLEEQFSKKEKKSFLNGCENVLFLHSLMLGRRDYATFLNPYRLDKSLYLNRNFLFSRIKEGRFDVVESLIDLSENVTFENSKVLKLIYIHSCRDYLLIKHLIDNHKFDINAHGNIGLDGKLQGTFIHALSLLSDDEANNIFLTFMKDYGSKVDFSLPIIDGTKNAEISVLDLIINNDSIDPSDKMERLSAILTYGNLQESDFSHLTNIIISEEVIARFYDSTIFEAFFSHKNFNSQVFNRESVLKAILSLDNAKQIAEVRHGSSNTINPISVVLDKFFKCSASWQASKTHPLVSWIKQNSNNPMISIATLNTLAHHFKAELNNIGLLDIQMPPQIIEVLKLEGLNVPEKTGIFSKMFKHEAKKIEVPNLAPISRAEIKLEPNLSKVKKSVPIVMKAPVSFNKTLFNKVMDHDVYELIDSICTHAEQFNTIATEENSDMEFIKHHLPKLLNKTIELYLVALSKGNKEEAARNIMGPLNMLNKRAFDVLVRQLENR